MQASQQYRFTSSSPILMKLLPGIAAVLGMLLWSATLVMAAPIGSDHAERQLTDLTQRFNSLDANWGRFQLSGGLTIAAATPLNKESGNPPPPDFSQQLSLNLDAYIDRNLGFSLNLSHQGGWGFSSQTANGIVTPMISSPQVEEAFLKFEPANLLGYLGRFRYSLGPIGLISDFTVNPAEGFSLQYHWRDYSLTGLYSRVNTVYKPNTTEIMACDDYLATRLDWSRKNLTLGFNMVPNGQTGEKNFSFDVTNNFSQSRICAELGWYSFHSTVYPDLEAEWTPGIIFAYSINVSPQSTWQFKLGYIPFHFQPSNTSLAYRSGDEREWFLFNSQGIEISQQQSLPQSFRWQNRVILFTPVTQSDTYAGLNYHWRSSLTKDFSPVNQLEFDVDLLSIYGLASQQAQLKWNLRF